MKSIRDLELLAPEQESYSGTPSVSLESQSFHSSLEFLMQHWTKTMLTSPNSQAALTDLTEQLGTGLSVDGCAVVLMSPQHSPTHLCCWNPDSHATSFYPFPAHALPVLNHVNVSPETPQRIIPDVRSDPQATDLDIRLLSPSSIGREPRPAQAILAAAVQYQDHVNGIVLVWRSHAHPWTEEELAQFQAMTDILAIAISQVQISFRLDQQKKFQALMNQLNYSIHGITDAEQIFQVALRNIVSALQLTRGMVLLLKFANPLRPKLMSPSESAAKVAVVSEWIAPCANPQDSTCCTPHPDASHCLQFEPISWLGHTFSTLNCILCRQLIQQASEPIVYHDIQLDPELQRPRVTHVAPTSSDIAPVFESQRLPSLLLVPLEHRGKVLGGLVLQHQQPRHWSVEEVGFIKLIAGQLSTAMMQQRTLQQVQSLVDKRTAQLQQSMNVQLKLYRKVRHQLEQLQKLNQLKDEFMSTLSHELRTPLTSMTLAIRMLRQAALSPERRSQYLDILETQCVQETNLINDLLFLQELESKPIEIQRQPVDLHPLLLTLIQSFEASWATKGLSVRISIPEDLPEIQTDSASLKRILTELLNNASKYADLNSAIELTLQSERRESANWVRVEILNTGQGISADEMPHIFEKFRRGQGVTQQAIQGTGLGLALVKRLADRLQMEISASSSPLESGTSWQTCFMLTIPSLYPEAIGALENTR